LADGLSYYDLEQYLFETVHDHFHSQHRLDAFDFISIIIWKANRAKTKVVKRILASNSALSSADLDSRISILTGSLHTASEHRERLRILMEDWGFRLPMATAVLTVLWPEFFTVYDARVCDHLEEYHKLANLTRFDNIWQGYEKFRASVIARSPPGLSLRDKDRWIWGTSSAKQLGDDIETWNQAKAARAPGNQAS